ncbi:hypothetical protein ACHAL6_06725 [Proteiniclasticum sp. C24MP]|uniref:hypothetical protein n=1 Tax=Proteiniclasticum sp. C24MP TaxID=3374101 RepID=UPI00375476E7
MHPKITIDRPDFKILYLPLLLVALFLLGAGCTRNSNHELSPKSDPKYTVTFVNMSQELISEIRFQQNLSSGGSMNADGSPLKRGERLFFDFDTPDTGALFSVLDEEKNILAAETVTFSFDEENKMTIHIENDKENLIFNVTSP